MSEPPLLLVVTGMPAAGKTTLARGLAARLRLPLAEKDELKESLEVLIERYRARPARHPGHLDEQRVDELVERYHSGRNGPLELYGELIEVDTTAPVDVDALAARLVG